LADPKTGSLIGQRYRLVELIGEGGMGSVWVAEQQQPVKRRVALKMIKAGMDSKQVLARFEAERQALAVMDHPNIAKVLDGGMTDQGRPFFVMEYVKGIPFTQYCDQAGCHCASGSSCSSPSAAPSSTPTTRGSCIATSSSPTS
jgi:serine/threonine protein kinase